MSDQTSAFVSIIGRPNVGKSSLMNRILGQKVSIVTEKPQTTRTKIMGIHTTDNCQLVFIDTPGFHKPKNLLGESMIKAVNDGMSDVDIAVLVVDAAPKFKLEKGEIPPAESELIDELSKRKLKAILVINKIDLLQDKEELLSTISTYSSLYEFESVIPLSAKNGDGVQILIKELTSFAKPSVHYFDDDALTDQPERLMVAEMIREKLMLLLTKEVPHGIAVDIEKFTERDTKNGEPIIDISAAIYCEKASHKGIIIGKGGAMLKNIGIMARKELEKFFGISVSLKLWVKVKEDWRNSRSVIHTLNLD